MARIYLASSWRNQHQPELVARLRGSGHSVYDFRNPRHNTGFSWQQIEGSVDSGAANFRAALNTSAVAARGFLSDMHALDWADTCLLLLPCGRSAHLEAGWAKGRGKRLIVFLHQYDEPELMYLMADHIVVNHAELGAALKDLPVTTP